MRTCFDCNACTTNSSGAWVCGKNTLKHVDVDTPACDRFISQDAHVCWECEYFEYGDDGLLFKRKSKCQLKGTNVGEYDRACSKFYKF